MHKSITYTVVGAQRIVCDGCEQRIEKLLKSMPGVDKARARMKDQRIEVLFDAARLDAEAIAQRLGSAGYEAKVTE